MEEVVGEAVYRQHSVGCRRVGLAAAHQRGDELAFPVGIRSQLERLLPVTGQHIWLPLGHTATIVAARGRPGPTWADGRGIA